MVCLEVEQNDIAEKYLNGQLDAALQDEFELHILDCSRCLASVELLQALREDLAARAPEIRSRGSVTVRLQWKWAAVGAFFLLILTAGLLSTPRLLRRSTKSAQSQLTATAKPGTAEAPHDQGLGSAGAAAPKKITKTGSPGNSRTDASPADAGSQTVPLQDNSQAAGEHGITAADAHAAPPNDKIANGATGSSPPVVESSQNQHERPKLLSDEGEKELFRLALANPPPYTFSGYTRYAKDTPSGSKPSGVRPGDIKRHRADGKRPAFQNAMLAYVDGNYERAGELLTLALKQEPPSPDTYFFFGVCRLLQRDAAGSIAPLKSALLHEQSPFTQGAHYYLAKAYLQTHDLSAAETELQAAASLTGDWTESARVELARLRALRAREGP